MLVKSLPTKTAVICTLLVTCTNAFAPSTTTNRPLITSSCIRASSLPSFERPDKLYFVDERTNKPNDVGSTTSTVTPAVIKVKKSPTKGGAVHKKGILSPIVQVSKIALGEEKLNKLRAKVISLHSDVIANFVETSDTAIGNMVLKQLFNFADKDKNGTITEDELRDALQTLGFDWLQEKQIKGIFERADIDANGSIDIDEWIMEAPRTLRTNLIKLAKKNGGDMGLLV